MDFDFGVGGGFGEQPRGFGNNSQRPWGNGQREIPAVRHNFRKLLPEMKKNIKIAWPELTETDIDSSCDHLWKSVVMGHKEKFGYDPTEDDLRNYFCDLEKYQTKYSHIFREYTKLSSEEAEEFKINVRRFLCESKKFDDILEDSEFERSKVDSIYSRRILPSVLGSKRTYIFSRRGSSNREAVSRGRYILRQNKYLNDFYIDGKAHKYSELVIVNSPSEVKNRSYFSSKSTFSYRYSESTEGQDQEKTKLCLPLHPSFHFEFLELGDEYAVSINPFFNYQSLLLVYHEGKIVLDCNADSVENLGEGYLRINEKEICGEDETDRILYNGRLITNKIFGPIKGKKELRRYGHFIVHGNKVSSFKHMSMSNCEYKHEECQDFSFFGAPEHMEYERRKEKSQSIRNFEGTHYIVGKSDQGIIYQHLKLNLYNKKIVSTVANLLLHLRKFDDVIDLSRCHDNVNQKIYSYDVLNSPNVRFRSFSKTYQKFVLRLHFMNNDESSIFSDIPSDVLRYKIIPFISEVDVLFGKLRYIKKLIKYRHENTFLKTFFNCSCRPKHFQSFQDLSRPYTMLRSLSSIRGIIFTDFLQLHEPLGLIEKEIPIFGESDDNVTFSDGVYLQYEFGSVLPNLFWKVFVEDKSDEFVKQTIRRVCFRILRAFNFRGNMNIVSSFQPLFEYLLNHHDQENHLRSVFYRNYFDDVDGLTMATLRKDDSSINFIILSILVKNNEVSEDESAGYGAFPKNVSDEQETSFSSGLVNNEEKEVTIDLINLYFSKRCYRPPEDMKSATIIVDDTNLPLSSVLYIMEEYLYSFPLDLLMKNEETEETEEEVEGENEENEETNDEVRTRRSMIRRGRDCVTTIYIILNQFNLRVSYPGKTRKKMESTSLGDYVLTIITKLLSLSVFSLKKNQKIYPFVGFIFETLLSFQKSEKNGLLSSSKTTKHRKNESSSSVTYRDHNINFIKRRNRHRLTRLSRPYYLQNRGSTPHEPVMYQHFEIMSNPQIVPLQYFVPSIYPIMDVFSGLMEEHGDVVLCVKEVVPRILRCLKIIIGSETLKNRFDELILFDEKDQHTYESLSDQKRKDDLLILRKRNLLKKIVSNKFRKLLRRYLSISEEKKKKKKKKKKENKTDETIKFSGMNEQFELQERERKRKKMEEEKEYQIPMTVISDVLQIVHIILSHGIQEFEEYDPSKFKEEEPETVLPPPTVPSFKHFFYQKMDELHHYEKEKRYQFKDGTRNHQKINATLRMKWMELSEKESEIWRDRYLSWKLEVMDQRFIYMQKPFEIETKPVKPETKNISQPDLPNSANWRWNSPSNFDDYDPTYQPGQSFYWIWESVFLPFLSSVSKLYLFECFGELSDRCEVLEWTDRLYQFISDSCFITSKKDKKMINRNVSLILFGKRFVEKLLYGPFTSNAKSGIDFKNLSRRNHFTNVLDPKNNCIEKTQVYVSKMTKSVNIYMRSTNQEKKKRDDINTIDIGEKMIIDLYQVMSLFDYLERHERETGEENIFKKSKFRSIFVNEILNVLCFVPKEVSEESKEEEELKKEQKRKEVSESSVPITNLESLQRIDLINYMKRNWHALFTNEMEKDNTLNILAPPSFTSSHHPALTKFQEVVVSILESKGTKKSENGLDVKFVDEHFIPFLLFICLKTKSIEDTKYEFVGNLNFSFSPGQPSSRERNVEEDRSSQQHFCFSNSKILSSYLDFLGHFFEEYGWTSSTSIAVNTITTFFSTMSSKEQEKSRIPLLQQCSKWLGSKPLIPVVLDLLKVLLDEKHHFFTIQLPLVETRKLLRSLVVHVLPSSHQREHAYSERRVRIKRKYGHSILLILQLLFAQNEGEMCEFLADWELIEALLVILTLDDGNITDEFGRLRKRKVSRSIKQSKEFNHIIVMDILSTLARKRTDLFLLYSDEFEEPEEDGKTSLPLELKPKRRIDEVFEAISVLNLSYHGSRNSHVFFPLSSPSTSSTTSFSLPKTTFGDANNTSKTEKKSQGIDNDFFEWSESLSNDNVPTEVKNPLAASSTESSARWTKDEESDNTSFSQLFELIGNFICSIIDIFNNEGKISDIIRSPYFEKAVNLETVSFHGKNEKQMIPKVRQKLEELGIGESQFHSFTSKKEKEKNDGDWNAFQFDEVSFKTGEDDEKSINIEKKKKKSEWSDWKNESIEETPDSVTKGLTDFIEFNEGLEFRNPLVNSWNDNNANDRIDTSSGFGGGDSGLWGDNSGGWGQPSTNFSSEEGWKGSSNFKEEEIDVRDIFKSSDDEKKKNDENDKEDKKKDDDGFSFN